MRNTMTLKERIKEIIKKQNLLQEGKKQALAIVKDQKIVDDLSAIDPTDTNKYVEMFAKFYKNGSSIQDIQEVVGLIVQIEKKQFKIDISKIKTIDEFKKETESFLKVITKGDKKKGISGIKLNVDYMDFGTVVTKGGDIYHGYIPLNYEASKVIASNRVGKCEGKWCISYQKSSSHWNDYVKKQKNFFILLIAEPNQNIKESDKKVAVQLSNSGLIIKVWDANDKPHNPLVYFSKE